VIELRADVRVPEISIKELKSTAQRLLAATGREEEGLSILLTDDARIREVNRAHRGKDQPTDVLSFPGSCDVVISVETARRQAADYDAPLQNEIHRLLIHGILHIQGHDHHEPAERAAMEAEERRLAGAIAMPWPYD
jgi:probable rRNA maturation factor